VGPLFFILWILAQSQTGIRVAGEKRPSAGQVLPARQEQRLPKTAPTPRPHEMSMYSAYSTPENEQKFEVRCRTQRSLSNIDAYIPIEAVTEEDVVARSGKILIPAGAREGDGSSERTGIRCPNWPPGAAAVRREEPGLDPVAARPRPDATPGNAFPKGKQL
jgi:hypothetical protein